MRSRSIMSAHLGPALPAIAAVAALATAGQGASAQEVTLDQATVCHATVSGLLSADAGVGRWPDHAALFDATEHWHESRMAALADPALTEDDFVRLEELYTLALDAARAAVLRLDDPATEADARATLTEILTGCGALGEDDEAE